jgi:opacity protein-like surface antigen
MRKYLLATAAAVTIVTMASPAMARDGSGYIGVEAGVMFPRDSDADVDVVYTTVNAPAVVGTPAGPTSFSMDDAISLDAKTGYDIGIYGGYDFGMFRLEGEVDWKHANLDDLSADDDLLAALSDDLNRTFLDDEIDVSEAVGSLAFMLNGLLDFGDQDGISFQAGVGAGWTKVKLIDDKDGAFAWQLILGAQYAISPNIDFGLRYKYFSTGSLDLSDSNGFTAVGSRVVDVIPPNSTEPVEVTQTTTADIFTDFESKFRAHSLVLTLAYNFAAPPPPPPPPQPPPPPPPPPPATQTCPDGSVILATDVCPAPPPPPPPPEPAPERGF